MCLSSLSVRYENDFFKARIAKSADQTSPHTRAKAYRYHRKFSYPFEELPNLGSARGCSVNHRRPNLGLLFVTNNPDGCGSYSRLCKAQRLN
jgi:hypothetical protein